MQLLPSRVLADCWADCFPSGSLSRLRQLSLPGLPDGSGPLPPSIALCTQLQALGFEFYGSTLDALQLPSVWPVVEATLRQLPSLEVRAAPPSSAIHTS